MTLTYLFYVNNSEEICAKISIPVTNKYFLVL
jgi:hypothetical protein